MDIFVSVGGTANDKQEQFVSAVEARLRAEGFNPRTVGRNTFSSNAPLKTVKELMDKCAGTVVIALERAYYPAGLEKRFGPKETPLSNVALPTSWNQIEAAMSYGRGLPLMVVVERGLKLEGLLEAGNDWYVQTVEPTPAALATSEFNGVLSDWKAKVLARGQSPITRRPAAADMTIGELVSSLKPGQLWTALAALAGIIVACIALGKKIPL